MLNNLTVIPSGLARVKDMAELENWQSNWAPTTSATMREELHASNALYMERFVRRNVSPKKFAEWLAENPRRFTTERELKYLAENPRVVAG